MNKEQVKMRSGHRMCPLARSRTLLAALALLGCSTAMAQKVDQWVDGIHYEMNENTNGEVVVTRAYVPRGADVVLLDEIMADDGQSYPVTVIGEEVFSLSDSPNIRSVKGNNITRLERDAFFVSTIESFDFPRLTKIGPNAFGTCHDLKRMDFPCLISTDIQVKLLSRNMDYVINYVSFGPMVQDLTYFHIQSDKLMYLACHAINPPKLNGTFRYADLSMPVHVPEVAIRAYQSASEWKNFTNFVPTGKWQLQLLSSDETLGTCMGAGNYAPEDKVTLVAVPSHIGKFKEWSDGNTENPRVMTLDKDMKLTAIFERAQKLPQGSPTGKHTAIVKKDGTQIIIDNSNIESIEWHEADHEKIR